MLETGSPAPDLTLSDTDGNTVRLADHRGRGAVLVYFMRATTCPVCGRHVRDLVRDAGRWAAANVQVMIAVPADRDVAARWKAERGIPFPVLAGRPHALVGLDRKVLGWMQQSGSVLIDSRGIVRHARAATMPTAGYDRSGIAAAVALLDAPA